MGVGGWLVGYLFLEMLEVVAFVVFLVLLLLDVVCASS